MELQREVSWVIWASWYSELLEGGIEIEIEKLHFPRSKWFSDEAGNVESDDNSPFYLSIP